MKATQIEIAIANLFDIRNNIIVPNVSWGLDLHECDVLVVRRKSGVAIEIEIKVTKADLKKDARKGHGHKSVKIRQLYFAVPEKLTEFALQTLDPGIGIIEVVGLKATIKRPAQIRAQARTFTAGEMQTLGALGTMRIWSLKRSVLFLTEELKRSRPTVQAKRKRRRKA